MKRLWILLVLPLSLSAQPSTSGMLGASRGLTNWSSAGAGAIPARPTVCQTLGTAGQPPSFNQSVTGAQIVTALQGCTSGQTVLLSPGIYTISPTLTITTSNVTLRGSGANQTTLKFTGTTFSNCLGLGPVATCIWNGDSGVAEYASNVLTWTAGYAQGATTITLGSAPTGYSGLITNLHVGSLLQLNQLNPLNDNGNWWNCGAGGLPGNPPPLCTWGGSSNYWPGRSLQQIVTVTGISGNNVTFTPGLYAPIWSSGQTPYVDFSSTLPITGFGLESLAIDTQSLGDMQAQVNMVWATNSWIKNVAFINAVAPGAATRKHVLVSGSSHLTIRDSYLYGSSPTSEAYGVDLSWGSGDNLVENNIFHHMATATILENGSGNVFGYNYAADNFYVNGDPNWQQCDAFHHDAGDYYDLWEGHFGTCFEPDDMHGTSFGLTAFRSYFSGHDPATTCPPGSPSCGTGTKLQNTAAVNVQAYSRYANVFLNVLGTSTYHTTYQNVGLSGTPSNCPSYSWTIIYSLGFASNNQTPFSPACGTGYSFTVDNDSLSSTTLARWGNYDTVNGSVQTNSSETASGAPTYPGLASPSTTWASYPSFYLAAKPSWWVFPNGNASTPWPSIGPEITGGNVSGVGGHVYLTPAANCYLNVLGGMTDGSSGPLNYDASNCYPASGVTTFTWAPTISPPAGGTISGTNCPSGSYASGATIGPCSAAANPNYTFTSWSNATGSATTCTGATNPTPSFSLTANSGCTANFTLTTQAATPTAAPAAGVLSGPTSIALSDTTSGAAIHFTTDGSTPTSGSPTYSSPISLSYGTTTVIKAIAIASGFTNSNVLTSQYTVVTAGPQALVQGTSTGTSSSSTMTLTGVVLGDAIIAGAYYGNGYGQAIAFSDSMAGVWNTKNSTGSTSFGLATDQDSMAYGCMIAPASGSVTVTITPTGGGTAIRGVLYEAKGTLCTPPGGISPSFSNTLAASACNSGSLTLPSAALLVGFCGTNGSQSTMTAGSGWSNAQLGSNSGIAFILGETQLAASSGTFTATSGTFSGTSEQGTIIAAFAPSTPSSGTCADPVQLGPNYSGTYQVPPLKLPINIGWSSPTGGCNMFYTFASGGPVPPVPTCGSAAYPGGNFNLTVPGTFTYRVIACQSGFTSSNVVGGQWNLIGATAPPSITLMGVTLQGISGVQ